MMKKMIVAASVLVLSLSTVSVHANQDLARTKNCMACHSIDKKIVGPSFKDVAAKYKGQAGAEQKLIAKVRAGGSGSWGAIPMPPNPQVNDADLQKLVRWILTQ
jgi:cytochrome c